jgi:flagellar hook-associated protein 1 FlgK
MGNLFSSLHTASAALDAFTRALGVEQTNVSNASTPGYAARQASISPIDLSGDGGTVSDAITLSATPAGLADAAVRAASSQAAGSQTTSQFLSPINQLLDITGSSGILAAFQKFSSAFSTLSVTPNDATLQANALAAIQTVASDFQSTAASLDSQRSQVDSSIQQTVSQINSLAQNIRQLNVQASGGQDSGGAAGASLRNDLDQLSSLVDINVGENPDGTVSVLAGGQLPLVEGSQAYALTVDPNAPVGSQVSSSSGGPPLGSFSGKLGALLNFRGNSIDAILGSATTPGTLNTLAAGFAARVNDLFTSGVTGGGSAGVPVFSYDATNLTNAARTFSVIPTVNPSQLALGLAGPPPQSNAIANQLSALPSSGAAADLIGGLSPEGLFGSIASGIGQQLSDASDASTTDQANLTAAQTDRQHAIGVSLDEEAARITEYQRGYEANAQAISVVNQLLSDAINIVSGASPA